jgi:hypothetical protein
LVGLPEAAFEAGAQQAAEGKARSCQPEHPRLLQGRSYFDLKVGALADVNTFHSIPIDFLQYPHSILTVFLQYPHSILILTVFLQ